MSAPGISKTGRGTGIIRLVATALESVNGNLIETARDVQDNEHYCRALPFIDGHLWADFDESKPELLADLGQRLALLDQALAGFSHPGLERPLLWNMELALPVLEDYKPLLASACRTLASRTFRKWLSRTGAAGTK